MIEAIKNFLGDRYQLNEYPALAYQYELWRRTQPLKDIKVLDGTPEGIIRKAPFRKKTVNMWIPFQRTSKGMKNADKSRNEVFRFIQFKEHA